MTRRARPLAAVLLLLTSALHADDLRWRSLDVTAKIGDDGTLHATERHTMIFNGEWNGGQRSIAVKPGQSLTFNRVARVTTKKREVPLKLVEGAPDDVDEYALFNNGTTIRWRARLPEDPPFRDKKIVYVIEYTLTNVVFHRGPQLAVDHDFAFADRPGPIEHFSVILDLPPSWKRGTVRIARDNIRPGEGHVVKEAYWLPKPANAPAAAAVTPAPKVEPSKSANPMSHGTAQAIVVGLMIVGLLFIFRFLFGERAMGRFERIPSSEETANEMLKYDAELVGVAWDNSIGSDEVAAILARMTTEGKIESVFERGDMILKLKVPYDTLRGYEADLVRALFLGKTETSTSAVREHYAATGFDPARVIAPNLSNALGALPQWQNQPRGEWFVFWVLFALTIVLGIAGGRQSDVDTITVLGGMMVSLLGLGLTFLFTLKHKRAVTGVGIRFFFGLLVPVVCAWFWSIVILREQIIHHLTGLAIACASLTLVVFAIERMKIDQSREKVLFRRSLAAARKWLAAQTKGLGTPVQDQWVPYLYALGLTNEYSWHVTRVPPPPVYSPVRQYYDASNAAYEMEREADRLRDARWRLERDRARSARSFTQSFVSSPSYSSSSSDSSWSSSDSSSSSSDSSSSSSSSSGSSGSTGGGSGGGW